MKVKVTQHVQCCHEGDVYRPADVADVPDRVAREWIRSGWCIEVAEPEAKPKG
jgi:hypothetical protein